MVTSPMWTYRFSIITRIAVSVKQELLRNKRGEFRVTLLKVPTLLQTTRAPWVVHSLDKPHLCSPVLGCAFCSSEILRLGSRWLLNVIIPRTQILYYKAWSSLPGVEESTLTLSHVVGKSWRWQSSAKAGTWRVKTPGLKAAEVWVWEKVERICTFYVMEGNIHMHIHLYDIWLCILIRCILIY